MKTDKGLELGTAPNDKYAKFFEKFKEIDTVPVESWNTTHILAYFCKKYKEQYDMDYSFKFNSPSPVKCFEVFQVKRLAMLLTSNPVLLREYIDWIYANKVVKAKRRLTSISFMTNEGVVNEYKVNVLLAGKKNLNVDRSTPLPSNFKAVFQAAGTTINTYGELAFVSQMDPLSPELTDAMQKIVELGFDQDILGRIV